MRYAAHTGEVVIRRDALLHCPSCGRALNRKARLQRYCSSRCREREKKARQRSHRGHWGQGTRVSPKPPKKCNGINGSQGAKGGLYSGIFGPGDIIKAEVFGGRWDRVVSDDGVACHVRRKPAARNHKAEPAAPDTKPAKARKGKGSSQAEVTP
jgi:hypothetical protein